jgi:hypothetical protein
MSIDAGSDAGLDAGSDAGPKADAGRDGGQDAGPPPYTGCTCGTAGVCGTGLLGDPLRCCNYAEDDCLSGRDAGVCTAPRRCSPKPPCCQTGTCFDDVSCQGSGECVAWFGSVTPPDGTPCDDGRACSTAEPAPALIDCVGFDAGPSGEDCKFDYSAAFPDPASCPRSAPVCSGRDSAFNGNGGQIFGARCCPAGMACDFRPGPTLGKCLGNFGRGLSTNDVCRGGVCSADDAGSCP